MYIYLLGVIKDCIDFEKELIGIFDGIVDWMCENWEGKLGMGGGVRYYFSYVWWFCGG